MVKYQVTAGTFNHLYHTEYHAEQMARALRLNGMQVEVKPVLDRQ